MTSIEWLDEQIQEYVIAADHVANTMVIQISFEEYMDLKRQGKEMHKKEIIDACNSGNSEKPNLLEISDEEIEKAAQKHFSDDTMWSEKIAFKLAIKWYKEQLKQK